MGLFAMAKPKRIVVKEYGRDLILFAAMNPLMSLLMVRVLGRTGRSPQYEARVALAMEQDAVKMAKLGYRIVSTREYEVPRFGIGYQQVTYELVDRP
jgi:hypothetical protein